MTTTILAAALAYAARGWHVFPCRLEAKSSHKCAKFSDGRPWGATRDTVEIRQDSTRWPNARIGIVTGAISGIVVVETDTPEGHKVDGIAALRELEAKYGPLPETLMAGSPSGSLHRYFQHPGTGIKIKNSASEIGAGIDCRGDGGMVVGPPSINPDGRRYRWLNRLSLAPMPTWLVELTREKPRPIPTISERALASIRRPSNGSGGGKPPGNGGYPPHAYGQAALEYEIDSLIHTAPGSRNHALNRASFSLHQLVAGGELNSDEVRDRLIDASIINGLADDDGMPSVMSTIESGRRAGLQCPRSRSDRS